MILADGSSMALQPTTDLSLEVGQTDMQSIKAGLMSGFAKI
jgi:hypothetical protein